MKTETRDSFFRKQLKRDIKSVFLNNFEFATMHTIFGEPRVCIVDDVLSGMSGPNMAGFDNASAFALDEEIRTLYIAEGDIEKPIPGQDIEIDGEIWRVSSEPNSVTEADGLFAIKITRAFS